MLREDSLDVLCAGVPCANLLLQLMRRLPLPLLLLLMRLGPLLRLPLRLLAPLMPLLWLLLRRPNRLKPHVLFTGGVRFMMLVLMLIE